MDVPAKDFLKDHMKALKTSSNLNDNKWLNPYYICMNTLLFDTFRTNGGNDNNLIIPLEYAAIISGKYKEHSTKVL